MDICLFVKQEDLEVRDVNRNIGEAASMMMIMMRIMIKIFLMMIIIMKIQKKKNELMMKGFFVGDMRTTARRLVFLLIPGPPVEVGVTMYVLSISSVSEVLMVQCVNRIRTIKILTTKKSHDKLTLLFKSIKSTFCHSSLCIQVK